ncbi:MAG: monovalent cation/H+ antiporter complex subunit F, partial [Sulfolobales archaeon]
MVEIVFNVTQVLEMVIFVYIASMVMFFVRILRGPTIFDRVIAVDALSCDLAVFMALIALYTGNPHIAFPMIFIALWAYVLDLYVSKYLEFKDIGE